MPHLCSSLFTARCPIYHLTLSKNSNISASVKTMALENNYSRAIHFSMDKWGKVCKARAADYYRTKELSPRIKLMLLSVTLTRIEIMKVVLMAHMNHRLSNLKRYRKSKVLSLSATVKTIHPVN